MPGLFYPPFCLLWQTFCPSSVFSGKRKKWLTPDWLSTIYESGKRESDRVFRSILIFNKFHLKSSGLNILWYILSTNHLHPQNLIQNGIAKVILLHLTTNKSSEKRSIFLISDHILLDHMSNKCRTIIDISKLPEPLKILLTIPYLRLHPLFWYVNVILTARFVQCRMQIP